MKKLMTAAALVAMISAPAFAAGDAEAGKAKSAACAACHGADGISTMDIYPNLAGQKAAYIVSQLKAFKAGERNNPIMAPMAMPLSDQDMEDLAAYYASM
ncbi:cytochrome c [Oceanimonas sp. CHS3-5]|uniref:c-type cytochrome n=1 Tax=Oceanimonas sp. CHS3-5 TaxID=3068186 RepID=UPI00273D28C1|nr:cytochrome c [Oceanimonas sp. CHS3-5]MDP5292961.1 cytochrome c [Oceanimonas sp. CHS3-5]